MVDIYKMFQRKSFTSKTQNKVAIIQVILKTLGLEGDYEGIGHLALGYADGNLPKAAKRKENRIFYIE